jgi:hypothetical protein
MLGRNQEEVELFDRLDRELQWPEPEGEDAIPDWLGYSPEELNRVRPPILRLPSSPSQRPPLSCRTLLSV